MSERILPVYSLDWALDEDGADVWFVANRRGDWISEAFPTYELAQDELIDIAYAAFDTGGLVDLELRPDETQDLSGDELNAWTSDVLAIALTPDHPCWLVCVGQFHEAGYAGERCEDHKREESAKIVADVVSFNRGSRDRRAMGL